MSVCDRVRAFSVTKTQVVLTKKRWTHPLPQDGTDKSAAPTR